MLAVNMAVGPTIMLHSGAPFDFPRSLASEFTIEDVAHDLSNICRYAGQCRADRSPFKIAEFVTHDSKPQFWSLNHGTATELNFASSSLWRSLCGAKRKSCAHSEIYRF